ncbi:MAG: hypothetical protein JRI23_22005 [Deltaproteobacteria bacterium]|jgi:hypothetical protein|nr:hypothetical protein [Deltaproteobacteria bacterium]MBW2534633.1 hypothetical protein [Deltaproteobacteria bacterium]
MRHIHLLIGLAIAVAAACVPAPKKNYTPAEVEKLPEIEEVMRVLAHEADPLFSIRDQETFSDDELARMKQAGMIIQRAAVGLADNHAETHGGESFRRFAHSLGTEARNLEESAGIKKAPRASAALSAMKEVCAGCHSKHR